MILWKSPLAGVPLAPVMAFWVASPTMDPEFFALSVGMLGWPLALARLLGALALSLGAGYLTLMLVRSGLLGGKVLRWGAFEKYGKDETTGAEGCCKASASREPVLVSVGSKPVPIAGTTTEGGEAAEAHSCGTASCEPEMDRQVHAGWWQEIVESIQRLDRLRFAKEVLLQSWFLGRWLLLAFVVEALILFYVPQETIAGVLGGRSAFAVSLAALVGLPLYMNEMGTLPIVSGLLESGMQPGAAITFLIAGPLTTVAAMAAVWGVVSTRVFALYVGVGLVGSVLLGLATNLLLNLVL